MIRFMFLPRIIPTLKLLKEVSKKQNLVPLRMPNKYVRVENKQSTKSNQSIHGIAGAASGILTRAVTQPLDVVKIRLQLQVEPISNEAGSKYKGFFQAVYLIFKEEGVKGWWRGHMVGQCHSALFGLLQGFETIRLELDNLGIEGMSGEHLRVHFLAGGLAGCLSTTVCYPLDIIRGRLVAQGDKQIYHGILHGFSELYRKEGKMGFWRGLTPALYIAGPHAGLQFYFYKLFKNTFRNIMRIASTNEKYEVNRPWKMVAASLAGSSAKFFTHPFDLARRRMQIQEFQYARKGFGKSFHCMGMTDCFIQTIKLETPIGLYKGLTPSLLKAAVTTMLHFTIYEEIAWLMSKRTQ